MSIYRGEGYLYMSLEWMALNRELSHHGIWAQNLQTHGLTHGAAVASLEVGLLQLLLYLSWWDSRLCFFGQAHQILPELLFALAAAMHLQKTNTRCKSYLNHIFHQNWFWGQLALNGFNRRMVCWFFVLLTISPTDDGSLLHQHFPIGWLEPVGCIASALWSLWVGGVEVRIPAFHAGGRGFHSHIHQS